MGKADLRRAGTMYLCFTCYTVRHSFAVLHVRLVCHLNSYHWTTSEVVKMAELEFSFHGGGNEVVLYRHFAVPIAH